MPARLVCYGAAVPADGHTRGRKRNMAASSVKLCAKPQGNNVFDCVMGSQRECVSGTQVHEATRFMSHKPSSLLLIPGQQNAPYAIVLCVRNL
ncbi:uncharacterized [Tachysurus ichikawai]